LHQTMLSKQSAWSLRTVWIDCWVARDAILILTNGFRIAVVLWWTHGAQWIWCACACQLNG
jgi:hypothetical protein